MFSEGACDTGVMVLKIQLRPQHLHTVKTATSGADWPSGKCQKGPDHFLNVGRSDFLYIYIYIYTHTYIYIYIYIYIYTVLSVNEHTPYEK